MDSGLGSGNPHLHAVRGAASPPCASFPSCNVSMLRWGISHLPEGITCDWYGNKTTFLIRVNIWWNYGNHVVESRKLKWNLRHLCVWMYVFSHSFDLSTSSQAIIQDDELVDPSNRNKGIMKEICCRIALFLWDNSWQLHPLIKNQNCFVIKSEQVWIDGFRAHTNFDF